MSNMNRDVEEGPAAAEPMDVGNSQMQEDNIRWINSSVLVKAKLVQDMQAKGQLREKELREKLDRLRSLKERNAFEESEVAGLEFREQEALATMRQKQDILDESRREVERLQRLLKEEKKIQTEKLTKHEDSMRILSEKFVNAPVINDAKVLEIELKVLQAKSNEVRNELVAVKQELQELMQRYSLMTNTTVCDQSVASEHNTGIFIQQVIHDMQAEVSREKKRNINLTEHMASLKLNASNMRRELDNIKSKK